MFSENNKWFLQLEPDEQQFVLKSIRGIREDIFWADREYYQRMQKLLLASQHYFDDEFVVAIKDLYQELITEAQNEV